MHELLPFGELAQHNIDHEAEILQGLQSWELAHILRLASHQGGQASVAALMAARHHARAVNRTCLSPRLYTKVVLVALVCFHCEHTTANGTQGVAWSLYHPPALGMMMQRTPPGLQGGASSTTLGGVAVHQPASPGTMRLTRWGLHAPRLRQ